MRGRLKFWFLCMLYMVFAHSSANNANEGSISGTVLLDETWNKTVYLSLIETIENKYAVSNEMIIASSPIDSAGNFTLSLAQLPDNWTFLRLHVVKNKVTPASLIIGSKDENHYFIIANRSSQIVLENTLDVPIFGTTTLSGAPYMQTFNYINKLVVYSNSIDYESSGIEKEFIDRVVAEKLKAIADTCTNPLVSLYALYQYEFKEDFKKNPNFYNIYLAQRVNENNSYFNSFKRYFPAKKTSPWFYILFFFIAGIIVFILIFLLGKKERMLKTLSIQERKIFHLLREGSSNQEIASKCHIEVSTVKSHVGNIYIKLKVKSRKEAINLNVK